MLKQVGNSGQLTLGKKFAGKYYQVQSGEGGTIILTPMEVVPTSEAWFHSPEMMEKRRQHDAWATKHTPKATDLEAFLKKHKVKG